VSKRARKKNYKVTGGKTREKIEEKGESSTKGRVTRKQPDGAKAEFHAELQKKDQSCIKKDKRKNKTWSERKDIVLKMHLPRQERKGKRWARH